MNALYLHLVDWTNGVWMIGLFALVCVVLIATALYLVFSGSSKDQE